MIIGEIMMPISINIADEKYNLEILSKLLNEGNVFDVELNPKNEDRLLLSFTVKPDKPRLNYGYGYNKGKWVESTYVEFEWMHNHDEEKEGEIIEGVE